MAVLHVKRPANWDAEDEEIERRVAREVRLLGPYNPFVGIVRTNAGYVLLRRGREVTLPATATPQELQAAARGLLETEESKSVRSTRTNVYSG